MLVITWVKNITNNFLLFLEAVEVRKKLNKPRWRKTGQTIATCERNISQHCWVQHVSVKPPCCDMLGVLEWNLSRQHPTRRNVLRPPCCDMLRWHVAIVWPGYMCHFFQNVKMVCQGTAVGTIKDGTITCFFSEMSPTFYGIAALYSPSDFCINWRYSGKGENKVHSLQLSTQKIKITFKAATNDLFFLVLTRLVVNLISNQGSDIFILMQMV